MKKQINVVLNGKKGAGKTFFATHFVQFLKDHRIDHRAIDTDIENPTLKQFQHEADLIDVRNIHEIDLLFGALQYTNLVVADCHAASTEIFLDYFDEVRVFEVLAMVDAAITVILPVNSEADSADQLTIIAEKFQAQCHYLIVKNQVFGEDFTAFDRSGIRNRVIEELGGREIIMPKLYDWLVTGLNGTKLSITDAITYPGFFLVDRQRLKNWKRVFYDQLSSVLDILLPTDSGESIAKAIHPPLNA